jgi:hypothetical protein
LVKIREIFSEETKAKEQTKRTLRAKRRQTQAENLKKSLSGKRDSFMDDK